MIRVPRKLWWGGKGQRLGRTETEMEGSNDFHRRVKHKVVVEFKGCRGRDLKKNQYLPIKKMVRAVRGRGAVRREHGGQ